MDTTTCPAWCGEDHREHDGYRDLDHFAPRGEVPLSLEPPVHMMPSDTWEPPRAAVALDQPDGGPARVLIDHGDRPDMVLTADEAAQLAAVLAAAADDLRAHRP